MNDVSPKPRPRFQLHLSTCVVLMVVAGALVWANTTVRHVEEQWVKAEVYGYPFDGLIFAEALSGSKNTIIQKGNLIADISIALAILALTAVACERWIRRRERKRLASTDSQPGCEIKSAFL